MVECEFNPANPRILPFCSFNRYMVECESVLVEQKDIVEQVLIDTWWNVNAKRSVFIF